VTSTRGISEPRSVDLLPPTLQTIPEAIGRNIAATVPTAMPLADGRPEM